jgi:hypothetical protein
VAVVDHQPALDLAVLDADHLDAERPGEAPGEALLEALRRDVRAGQRRSSAAPSS